jgi:ornithine cyclodeaminase/alanine dehydrogenase-like protein (mu-crystallin family)
MLTSITSRMARQATTVRSTATATAKRSMATFPAARLFDYETITKNLFVADAIDAVEDAFSALAKGNVDVPMPMHIGITETSTAGPGDCHIKGGYVSGAKTFTVKLACVSFYKNVEKGLPPGSGVFCVVDAVTGAPLGIMQENRYMTDLRTGAAGAVSVKYTTPKTGNVIGFIGCGAIARNMARAAAAVRPDFKGVAFGLAGSGETFAKEMSAELGVPFTVAETAEELCSLSNCIFTQTPGGQTVLKLDWLKPGTTIIASGSDQPTKQEIPNDVLKASKYIADLVKQTSKVGELRGAIQAGVMTTDDVYAELGEIVNGKPGREGDELIVVDLTGTGAQDAAIGQVAWDKLSAL